MCYHAYIYYGSNPEKQLPVDKFVLISCRPLPHVYTVNSCQQELSQESLKYLIRKSVCISAAYKHFFLNVLRMRFNSSQPDETKGKYQWCPWIVRQHTFVLIPPSCGYVDINSCVNVSVPAETHHKLPNDVLFHYQRSLYCHANMQNCLEWIQHCNGKCFCHIFLPV